MVRAYVFFLSSALRARLCVRELSPLRVVRPSRLVMASPPEEFQGKVVLVRQSEFIKQFFEFGATVMPWALHFWLAPSRMRRRWRVSLGQLVEAGMARPAARGSSRGGGLGRARRVATRHRSGPPVGSAASVNASCSKEDIRAPSVRHTKHSSDAAAMRLSQLHPF